MQARSHSIWTLTSFIAISLADVAAADLGDPRGVAAGVRPRAALQRDFELAMADMDRDLAALLAPRMMDCASGDAAVGVEMCWVSLDSLQASEAPHRPTHD